jgi:hypothetical protein
MKNRQEPAASPAQAAQRPAPNAPLQQPVIVVQRRKDLAGQWKSVAIGGFAIAAVFIGLELTKQPPPKPGQAVAKPAVQPGAPVSKPEVAVVSGVAVASTPVDPAPVESGAVASVPAPAISKPQPTEVSAPTESELLGKEKELILTGSDAGREDAIARDKALFARAIDGKAWNAYQGLLARSIDAGMAKLGKGTGVNRFDGVWKEPALYQAFLRWQVLGRLSEPVISSHVLDAYRGEMLTWLCNNPAAMEEFMLTIKPEDDAGKVLKFLMEAWSVTTGEMEKYFPLALACAVVFDRDVSIPNPVGGEYAEKAVVDPMKRYMWFVEKNNKGLLAAPVHHSTARDLVWVVCAPVSTSELDWSLDKMHLSRNHWGNAYGMIEYLMERAVEGLNPYKEYTFSEILKEGGICGDQSYFSANTARAQGIPAMIFGGETDLGSHAWVGLKIKSDEWTTGVGRIGGVSKGQTGNPQTGVSISEQEVQLWSDRHHQSPVTTLSVARHLWLAGYFEATGKDDGHAEAVRLANQLGQSFTESWSALYALLQKQMKLTGEPARPNNLDDWKTFAKSMRREFKNNPRMAQLAANAENEFIFPYGEQEEAARALLRERRRIERDSGEQKDLIAESLKREADLILKRGDENAMEDISRLYDSALRKYGGSITGFKMMAEAYFGYLKEDPELAHKAARDIELAFKRVVETGTKEWFRANTESDIYKMICGYYRASGDEERAIMLEKRYEILLRRAERGAL